MRVERSQSSTEQVTNILNEAAVAPDENTKLDLLLKCKEILVYQDPKLLSQFINDVIAYQNDHNSIIRKFVVTFIEDCCKKEKSFVCVTLPNILMLLEDRSLIVQKRVVQAASNIYRVGLQWISMIDLPSSDLSNVWQDLANLKSHVINMIDNDNEGIRTQVIKFMETVILVHTYKGEGGIDRDNDLSLEDIPLTLKVTRRRKLEDEARVLFDLLSRFCHSGNVSCANMMTCVGSLTLIAKFRVSFIERVLNTLEVLAKNLPSSFTLSQSNSIQKNLKLQLLSLLRLPASTEHQQTIGRLLLDLGASNQEIMKALQVLSKNEDSKKLLRSLKRKNDEKEDKKSDKDDIPEKKRCTDILSEQRINSVKTWVLEKFSSESITNLIIAFMPKLPSKMPSSFGINYTPITAAGTDSHIQHVAKLLATQICCSDVIIPDLKCIKQNDESMEGIKEETIKMEEDDMLLAQAAELNLNNCHIDPIEAEELSLDALLRILDTSRIVLSKQFKKIHIKAITKMAVMCSNDFRNTILDYISLDVTKNMDLCLSWLYEEYSVSQGFIKLPTAFRNVLSPEQSYNAVLCTLIRKTLCIGDLKEIESALTTLYFESPYITDDAVDILKEICCNHTFGLFILNELVTKRPPRQLVYLNALLFYTSHKNKQLREIALGFINKLYKNKDLKNIIEEYATFYLGFLRLQLPPDVLFGHETGRLIKSEIWDEDSTTACLFLYFMLMADNYELIHELVAVFIHAQGEVKRSIIKLLPQPIQNMPVNSSEIFRLLEDIPKGAEAMIIRVLHIVTEKGIPSVDLISKVKKLFDNQIVEVRFLVPILSSLDKKYILNVLPQLIKLNPNVVKEVFNRILGINYSCSNSNPPLSPAELLIALHTMDLDPHDLKFIIKATSLCFAEKLVFTQEVLAIVMQNLMDINPLPTLLMRTVIQSLTTYPRLIAFIMNILQRLIQKKVWHQKKQWEGFIKCCQKTKPNCFQVLLQLPPEQLEDVLYQCPEMRASLLDHVLSFTEVQRSHIRQAIMDVIFGKKLDVPMYQNLKVKSEPVSKTQNQPTVITKEEKLSPEKISSMIDDELRPPGDCDEDSSSGK